jgi:hypothetical protein
MGRGLIWVNGNAAYACDVNPCLADRLEGRT